MMVRNPIGRGRLPVTGCNRNPCVHVDALFYHLWTITRGTLIHSCNFLYKAQLRKQTFIILIFSRSILHVCWCLLLWKERAACKSSCYSYKHNGPSDPCLIDLCFLVTRYNVGVSLTFLAGGQVVFIGCQKSSTLTRWVASQWYPHVIYPVCIHVYVHE